MAKNKNLTPMPTTPTVAEDVLEGLKNVLAYVRNEPVKVRVHRVPMADTMDVKRVREKAGLSQQDFAAQFGISCATLRNWEQGRRRPHGPARVLLTLIDRQPDVVQRVLNGK